MKERYNKFRTLFSSLKNRAAAFYILALAPFPLLAYCYVAWPSTLVIVFYAFILLVLKKPKLFGFPISNVTERVFGIILIVGSFFVNFFVSPFFPGAVFYGGINYAVYLLGLFLIFFNNRTLKEAFTPTFLIVAATASPIVSVWLEPYFEPTLPYFTRLVVNIVNMVGIKATITSFSANVFILYTLRGPVPFAITWACVGFESASVFAILLVIILFEEESCDAKTKVLWSVLGLFGTFSINVIRVANILLTEYFYGGTVSAAVHNVAGYILFIMWTAVFLYAFSKRKIILRKINSIRRH